MPQVSIQIANRTYELACGDGEEERVQNSPPMSMRRSANCASSCPGAPEIKLMVFASLLLADESREARGMAKAGRDGARQRHRQRRDAGDGARGSDHLARRQAGKRSAAPPEAAPIAVRSATAYIGGGADFCAVRGSLKTPGPIRSPGNCSWP